MEITCPSCEARYAIDAERLVPGRPTRCARCRQTWVPEPAIRDVAERGMQATDDRVGATEAGYPSLVSSDLFEPSPDPSGHGVRERPFPPFPAPAMQPPPVWIGWVATVVGLALFAWVVIRARHGIVAAWPASSRFYALVGLGGRS